MNFDSGCRHASNLVEGLESRARNIDSDLVGLSMQLREAHVRPRFESLLLIYSCWSPSIRLCRKEQLRGRV
jgi:hypothetical protein